MKIERERAEGRNVFTGYGEGWVAVNRTRYNALKPEIVLLGTGRTFTFPDRARLALLYNAGLT